MTATIRFAALGDSLTEGVGAPGSDGWRGWAALLAPSLAAAPGRAEYRNLATSGALSVDLMERQLPQALAWQPHFAAVLAGGNDTLRAGFDPSRTAHALDTVLGELAAAGAVPLTACLPDAGLLLGLPASLARPLARRMAVVNAIVHELSDRHRALHLHLARMPWREERALLSADRLHPSAAGHLLIAREYHGLLAAAGHRLGPPPEPVDAPPRRAGPPTCGGWRPGGAPGWPGAASTCCPDCWRWPPARQPTTCAVPRPTWRPSREPPRLPR